MFDWQKTAHQQQQDAMAKARPSRQPHNRTTFGGVGQGVTSPTGLTKQTRQTSLIRPKFIETLAWNAGDGKAKIIGEIRNLDGR